MPFSEQWEAGLAAGHRRQLDDAFRAKHGDPAEWKFARRSMSPKDLEKVYQAACREALTEQINLKLKGSSDVYNGMTGGRSHE